MEKHILAPSLLAADFCNLNDALKKINQSAARAVHFDVMDGIFVPEISFGQVVLRSIRHLSKLPFDVHLMTENPDCQIESFAQAGADWITFHYENTIGRAKDLLQKIKSLGKKAGISIKPNTSERAIENLLEFCDLVLVMTVEPGYGGQKIMQHCLEKVSALSKIKNARKLDFLISVDGGVTGKNLQEVFQSGVDVVVSGSAFFEDTLNWNN